MVWCALDQLREGNAYFLKLHDTLYLIYVSRLLRRVGQSGDARVSWEIRPQSGAPFNATSGSVNMPSGLGTVLLPLKVSHTSSWDQATLICLLRQRSWDVMERLNQVSCLERQLHPS